MNKRIPWLLLALLCGAVLVILLVQAPSVVRATDLTVCPDGPPTCQYSSVQAAVDAASPGDVIKVAAGLYADVNNYGGLSQVVYLSKTLTIRGGYTTAFVDPPDPDANPTILDAEGQGRVLYISGAISPTLEGLRLTGGDASGLGGGRFGDGGGGVYIHTATATISRCVIISNTASTLVSVYGEGGGVFLESSDALLRDTTIVGNFATTASSSDGLGGGLFLHYGNATLQGNTVASNTARMASSGSGGGVYLWDSDATLQDNVVQGNTAGSGGGLFIRDSYDAVLQSNVVRDNTAGTAGGGLYLFFSGATLQGNVVQGNIAGTAMQGYGGGLYLEHASNVTLEGNTVVSNTAGTAAGYFGGGGGLYILGGSNVTINNNVVQGNTGSREGNGSGGGFYLCEFYATLQGNTVQGNTASAGDWGYGGGLFLYQSHATLQNNTVQGNTASTADRGAGGGLHLSWSNAILQGNTVQGNTASTVGTGEGGGLYLSGSNATLQGNIIVTNTATLSQTAVGNGGGLWAGVNTPSGGTLFLTNNVIADNAAQTQGSGLWFGGDDHFGGQIHVHLSHNTIADNHSSGQGVYAHVYTTLVFTNTIIAGHDSAGLFLNAGTCDAYLEATLWHENGLDTAGVGTIVTGTINVYDDPAFVDPIAWDYHIHENSAATDAGVDAGVTTDMDGDPRPQGAGYDIGADEFICESVSNAQIQRKPEGDLFAGNLVLFVASADGTLPFHYDWTLDGEPVGGDRSTFEHTFETADTYEVAATISNACGQAMAVLEVAVQASDPDQPDLSLSDKSASLANVGSGDLVSYTLFLRNREGVAASVTLTDPIPADTTYVIGSAKASDGNPVTFAAGALHWSGQIISGTPVLVEFAVEVGTPPAGQDVVNEALLGDGLGHVLILEASSTYNPGYGLLINDGALATNIPTVTLRYQWNVDDGITHVQFSNDVGFGPEGNTTAWLPVDAVDPTYPGWVLDTSRDLRHPCWVYARFREAGGRLRPPVWDAILYDPKPPPEPIAELLPLVVAASRGVRAGDILVRVTATDANSGVFRLQLSDDPAFAQFTTYNFIGPTTEVTWMLPPSGMVYVRVMDRAGNLSVITSAQGQAVHKIYLPVVQRAHP